LLHAVRSEVTDSGRGTGIQSNEKSTIEVLSRTTRHTALDSEDYLKILSKVLAEVFVESPQQDVHLEQDLVQFLGYRRGLHVDTG
jgi:hypothetical protein